MDFMDLVVERRRQEAEGIASFELARDDGGPLPAFTAGAHIDVHLPNGLVRQYSLCSDPADRRLWRIAVLLEPASRGGSAAMHASVQEGTTLRVGKPRNHFPLIEVCDYLLIAGGIGITPLLAMARSLSAAGQDFVLHACFRSAARVAFQHEIARSAFAERVSFHCDDGAPGQQFALATVLAAGMPDRHLYVCGPGGFIDSVLSAARHAGWVEHRLHKEHFTAATLPASTAAGGFELHLARSHRVLQVPAERSALRVMIDAGIDVPYACESGVCGTCLTSVLGGMPDHRDSILTEAERRGGRLFTPCCSRALTPTLVVDA